MDEQTTTLLIDGAIATGLGLMVGLEREHHDIVGGAPAAPPAETLMGVRTFALLSLAGWASAVYGAGAPWVPAALLVAVTALLTVAVARTDANRGLTTEAAALVTTILGMLVTRDRGLALALGVITVLLLLSKPWFRRQVPRLRRADLTNTAQLVVALAIMLPLLPTDPQDPWGALPPRKIGLFVTLILAVSWAGYVLARLLGARNSAAAVGLLGGLVSSTALTAAMAQQGKDAHMRTAGQLSTCLACAVMSTRLIIVSAVVSPKLALGAAPAVGAMGAVMLLGAGWKWWQLRREGDGAQERPEVELENPMSLLSAIKWGLFMTAVLLAATLGKQYLGERGVVVTGALSGLADVDAITLAMARSVAGGELGLSIAVLTVTVAAAVNTVVKAGIALVTGGRAYGADVAKVFGASLAAGLAVAVVGVL